MSPANLQDNRPTLGSLFAGIGGIDLGFERAGFRTAWQVEINPYCRKVLARHFPEAERFEDVRTVGQHNLRPVDVIAGGFPCQDISNAGLRAGIGGERSGLWSEYARIIGELRPKFVLVENVAALLGRGMGRVLGDLAACGYDAEWECIPAAAVGAPHIRDRVFILAHTSSKRFIFREWKRHERRSPICQGNNWTEAKRGEDWQLATLVSGVRDGTDADWWQSQSRVVRSSNGFPDWVEQIRTLGNSVVPQIPELIARKISKFI